MTTGPRGAGGGAGVAAAAAAAVLAGVGWVLTLLRPWGDTGVARGGALTDGRPPGAVAALAVGAAAALLAAWLLVAGRRRTLARAGAGVAVVAGVGGGLWVVAVLGAQAFPRDGGLLAALTAATVALAGLLGLAASWQPGRAVSAVVAALGVAGLIAVVVAGGALAPGWPDHRVTAVHPATFHEDPTPGVVRGVGWTHEVPAGALATVLGGRPVLAAWERAGTSCTLDVRALEPLHGAVLWQVRRPVRCEGPRLWSLDGNGGITRVTLGDPAAPGSLALFFESENGRALAPSAAIGAVRAWTEGFGIAVDATTVRGLDPQTGVTVWTRPLPTCADGSTARIGLPASARSGGGAQSPADSADPAGAVPVVQANTVVVLGWSCPVGSATARHAWLVDVLGDAGSDRTVDLPTSAGSDAPVTFVPGLAAVLAMVPSAGDVFTLTGIPLAGGDPWSTAVAPVGAVAAVATVSAFAVVGSTGYRLLGAADGAVLAQSTVGSDGLVAAWVSLTGGLLALGPTGDATVRDPVTGEVRSTVGGVGCSPDTADGAGDPPPAWLANGSVVLGCGGNGTQRLVGLVQ